MGDVEDLGGGVVEEVGGERGAVEGEGGGVGGAGGEDLQAAQRRNAHVASQGPCVSQSGVHKGREEDNLLAAFVNWRRRSVLTFPLVV